MDSRNIMNPDLYPRLDQNWIHWGSFQYCLMGFIRLGSITCGYLLAFASHRFYSYACAFLFILTFSLSHFLSVSLSVSGTLSPLSLSLPLELGNRNKKLSFLSSYSLWNTTLWPHSPECRDIMLLSCQPRVTVTSCFAYKLIRDL